MTGSNPLRPLAGRLDYLRVEHRALAIAVAACVASGFYKGCPAIKRASAGIVVVDRSEEIHLQA